MTDNVAAFPGFSVPRSQAEPIAELVEICRELLAMAETGVLRGLGAALVVADSQMRVEARIFSGGSPDRYVLIAAVAHLRHMTDLSAWPDMAEEMEPNAPA